MKMFLALCVVMVLGWFAITQTRSGHAAGYRLAAVGVG
jgi:hypothetical protein